MMVTPVQAFADNIGSGLVTLIKENLFNREEQATRTDEVRLISPGSGKRER
jgi:hypothetical protein